MTQATIGIVANPASGKDVRRLVASASIFDNREKGAIIGRAISGAFNAGARKFAYVDDSHNISNSAMQALSEDCDIVKVPCPKTNSAMDTIRGAVELQKLNCIATLILGGDGTSRVFVKGWRDAVLLPLSTGTNNVFPRFAEATVAGAALGVLATGGVQAGEVITAVKLIDIEIEDEAPDIALIDVVATGDRFIGSRAVLDASLIQRIFLSRADPSCVGMTSLGGLLNPIKEEEDKGLYIKTGTSGSSVHAPIAPGLFQTVGIDEVRTVPFNEPIEFKGPCVLAFDGERERVIQAGQTVKMRLSRSGPKTLDIDKTMQLAACRQLFLNKHEINLE